jgi:geranylgeranyl transferase type-2 subunit beta
MIDRHDWINFDALRKYILNCQDTDDDNTGGGFADRPGNGSDVFHTFFGLGALSLMSQYDLAQIDATYALPVETLRKNFSHVI